MRPAARWTDLSARSIISERFVRNILLILTSALLSCCAHTEEREAVVSTFRTVGFSYTLTRSNDGTLIDSNVDGDAFVYIHGGGQILPGLERALKGMRIGQRKAIRLEASEAYGPFDPDAFEEVPIEMVPENARTPGAEFTTSRLNRSTRVHEVRDKTIVLDFNHPLAGQALTYSVRIISIE